MLLRHLLAIGLLLFVFPFPIVLVTPPNAIALTPSQATVTNNLADKKREKEDYLGAISDYTRAIKLEPKFAQAYYGRGLSYYQLNRTTEALADFDQAIQLQPDFAEAYKNRAILYQDSNLPLAIADAKKLVSLKPKDSASYQFLSVYYQKIGDSKSAVATMEQGIRNVKEDEKLSLQCFKMIYRVGAGDNAGVFQDAQEIIQSKSASLGIKSFAIYMLVASDNNYVAIQESDSLIVKNPKSALAQWLRGFIAVSEPGNNSDNITVKIQKAIPYFEKAIIADPRSDIGYSARQMARQLAGDLRGALNDANSALQLNKTKPMLYGNRAAVSWLLQDFKSALKDSNRAISLQRGVLVKEKGEQDEISLNRRFHFLRGASYEKLGNYRQALSDYDIAIKDTGVDDSNIEASLGLAVRNIDQPQNIQIIVYHYAAIIEDINFDSVLVSRGRVKLKLGDKKGGIIDLDQAIRLKETDSAYYQRGLARRDAGDKPGAIADLQVALAKAKTGTFLQRIPLVQSELKKLGVAE
jgi:tetratricopeptide (TPR) repeat protein